MVEYYNILTNYSLRKDNRNGGCWLMPELIEYLSLVMHSRNSDHPLVSVHHPGLS